MGNDKIELLEREIEELWEALRWCNQTNEKLLRMIRMIADQVEENSRNLKLLAEVCARKILLDDGKAFPEKSLIN
jgi:hypothetical protein